MIFLAVYLIGFGFTGIGLTCFDRRFTWLNLVITACWPIAMVVTFILIILGLAIAGSNRMRR